MLSVCCPRVWRVSSGSHPKILCCLVIAKENISYQTLSWLHWGVNFLWSFSLIPHSIFLLTTCHIQNAQDLGGPAQNNQSLVALLHLLQTCLPNYPYCAHVRQPELQYNSYLSESQTTAHWFTEIYFEKHISHYITAQFFRLAIVVPSHCLLACCTNMVLSLERNILETETGSMLPRLAAVTLNKATWETICCAGVAARSLPHLTQSQYLLASLWIIQNVVRSPPERTPCWNAEPKSLQDRSSLQYSLYGFSVRALYIASSFFPSEELWR